jgi:hypothetical protein
MFIRRFNDLDLFIGKFLWLKFTGEMYPRFAFICKDATIGNGNDSYAQSVAFMNTYIHKTEQRLRVRSDFIKNNPEDVKQLILALEKIDAIQSVKHQTHAGSVAIKFDKKELDCEMLLEILESNHWTKSEHQNFFIENAAINGTKSLLKGVATIALTRMFGPWVSRLIFN